MLPNWKIIKNSIWNHNHLKTIQTFANAVCKYVYKKKISLSQKGLTDDQIWEWNVWFVWLISNKPSIRPIFFFFLNETFLKFHIDMKCITYLGFSNYFKQKNCRLHSTRCAFEIKIEKKKRNKLKLDYAERAYKWQV